MTKCRGDPRLEETPAQNGTSTSPFARRRQIDFEPSLINLENIFQTLGNAEGIHKRKFCCFPPKISPTGILSETASRKRWYSVSWHRGDTCTVHTGRGKEKVSLSILKHQQEQQHAPSPSGWIQFSICHD